MQNHKSRLGSWISRLSHYSRHPSDTNAQRLRKAVLILLVGIYSISGVFWGAAYLALDRPLAGSFPLGYSVISGISLIYFFRSKRYKIFYRSQLILILILPFLLQWSLGGFAASGAVSLWSILSPIGALMFAGTRRAIPWFIVYVLLVAFAGIISGKTVQQPPLPPAVVISSFVMNIGGVSAIVFFLLRYFVNERDRAMAELDTEHRRVRQSLTLAMEVQQNLLPEADLRIYAPP